MKLPPQVVMKAAKKKRKEGPSAGQQAPAPKRLVVKAPQPPVVRVPPPPERPPSGPSEVDLTADTPPGEPGAEGPAAEPHARAAPEPCRAAEPLEPCPPPEAPPSPRRTAPEVSREVGGDRVPPAPPAASSFDDRRRAERLASLVVQPDYLEELRHLGASTFYREALTGLVRAINSFAVTRDVINRGDDIVKQARLDLEEAHARADAAERALEVALGEHAAAIKEANSRVETEANRLRAALHQLGMAESAVAARDLHIAELERAAVEDGARVARAEAEAASKVQEAEARASEAEAAAEARVAGAVREFMESQRFEEEVAEATGDAYLLGFRHGKEKVARVLDLPQALEVEPDCSSDGDDDGSGAAGP